MHTHPYSTASDRAAWSAPRAGSGGRRFTRRARYTSSRGARTPSKNNTPASSRGGGLETGAGGGSGVPLISHCCHCLVGLVPERMRFVDDFRLPRQRHVLVVLDFLMQLVHPDGDAAQP